MSLMMDDNLAGSGNTITEVASVSRRRRRGPRSIALRSAKPTLQASDKPSIPSLGTGPRVPLVSLFRPPAGATLGEIAMEGWLRKRGAQVKNIKKRYFMCTRVSRGSSSTPDSTGDPLPPSSPLNT